MVHIIKQFGYIIFIIVSVIVLISSIIYLAPVDPARLTYGQRLDNASLERKQKALHLDKPLYIQMAYYLNDISPIGIGAKETCMDRGLRSLELFPWGEEHILLKTPYLRESFQSGRSVASMIAAALPKTIVLAFASMLLACILGIFAGIVAALVQGTWLDNLILFFATLGISIPSYVSAIILALVFGYILGDYTGLPIQGSIIDLNDIGDQVFRPQNLILPAIALGIRPLSIVTQLMRSSLIETLSMPYITTARSKGLSFVQVIRRHALRNSLNPVATAITGWFASLLAGTFFVENVFNFKGIGELTVTALVNYDIPVILACVILISLIFITINLGVDVLYRWIDPRLKSANTHES